MPTKGKKILFIANYEPETSPGQRFRFEQYLDFLRSAGYESHISYLLIEEDIRMMHSKGRYFKKAFVLVRGFFRRIGDVMRASEFDLIVIHREAFFAGPEFFESWFRKSKAAIVYDFDDAIWLENVSEANKRFSWLKNPGKTPSIIAKADMVFAGNNFLANYASAFNSNIKIVPTTIDTDLYQTSKIKRSDGKICIGWSGSVTTIRHFELAIPCLERLMEKYGNRIYFKVIGDSSYANEKLGIRGTAWKEESEVQDLSEIDIGLMPLPVADDWAKGKCGLKGLQYMALEIPTLMSPVGVNTEIITAGENGFLPATNQEWFETISLLIESPELRERIGKAGRKKVFENFSYLSQRDNYAKYFSEVILAKTMLKNDK